MLNRLRSRRKRSFQHLVVAVLLISWLFLPISASCAMPMTLVPPFSTQSMPAVCPDMAHRFRQHHEHFFIPDQACSFQPCLDSDLNPAFEIKIDKPQMPLLVLCLIGLAGFLFLSIPIRRIPCAAAPPLGRRLLLIYRFCTLLN